MPGIQSVVFQKRYWSKTRAEGWLRKHGFRVGPADEKENTLRYRQQEPVQGAKYYTQKTKKFPGVDLVIERKGGGIEDVEPEGVEAPPEGVEIFLKPTETSDTELADWAANQIPLFKGVVARQDLEALYPRDHHMEPGTSCIINLDLGYIRGGTHWCCMRVSSEAPLVLYYDPFGQPPPNDVTVRAWADGRNISASDVPYQGATDVNCGPRCLAVLYDLAQMAAKGEELQEFARIAQL